MIKLFLITSTILCFFYSPLTSAVSEIKADRPLIYNEEAITEQLKGKDKEEVLKILGNPVIKKPCEECEEDFGYWWYKFPETGIFVYFKDDRVYNISVLTEDKRSKEL